MLRGHQQLLSNNMFAPITAELSFKIRNSFVVHLHLFLRQLIRIPSDQCQLVCRRYLLCVVILVNGIGALLFVSCLIKTLSKRGIGVFEYMTQAESVSVEAPLFAHLGAVRAKRLIVQRWEVNILSFIHNSTQKLPESIQSVCHPASSCHPTNYN